MPRKELDYPKELCFLLFYISVDPILDGTEYDLTEYVYEVVNFTAYLYVRDNPLRWVDPLGLRIVAQDTLQGGGGTTAGLDSAAQGTPSPALPLIPGLSINDNSPLISPLVEFRIEFEDVIEKGTVHTYAPQLRRVQEMLNYLGYADIAESVMGIDYGGATSAAVYLFQMNYGMTITRDGLDSNTYLAIANAYINKRFSNCSADMRKMEYNKFVMQLMIIAGGSGSYYRKFQCTMRQGINSSILSSHGVTAVKKNGIYYLDYTTVIQSLLGLV